MTEHRVQLHQYCEECSQIITPCLECGREESIEPFQVLLRNVFKDKFDDCHLCIIIRDRIKKQEQFSEHSIKTRNTECMVEVRCHTWLFDPSIRDPPNGLALVKRYSAFRQALGGDKLCIAFAVEIEFLQGALDISPVQLKIERYTSM